LFEQILEKIKEFFRSLGGFLDELPDMLNDAAKASAERRKEKKLKGSEKKYRESTEIVAGRSSYIREAGPEQPDSSGKGRTGIKLGFDTGYFVKTVIRFGVSVLAIATVFYFGYHLMQALIPSVTTGEVKHISESFSTTGTAYLLRDAERIKQPVSGFADYLVGNGERVAKSDKLCNIYDTDRSDIRETIDTLDAELALLRKSAGGGISAEGILTTKTGISSEYDSIMMQLSSGNITVAGISADSFREKLARQLCLTGFSSGISDRIDLLSKQRTAAVQSLGTAVSSVRAGSSGYFFYGADGYENIFDLSLAEEFTEEAFRNAVSKSPESFPACIGTLAKSSEWKLCVFCPGFDMLSATTGKSYKVTLTDDDCLTLDMKLEKKLRCEDGMLLLFNGASMPKECSWLRCQNVSIVYEEFDGYRVPAGAVRSYEGMTGVYTLESGHVTFRRISVLAEGEGYYIVADYESASEKAPEVTRYLPYGMSDHIASTSSMLAFAEKYGLKQRNYRNGGIDFLCGEGWNNSEKGCSVLTMKKLPRGTLPLAYGTKNVYYYMLNSTDEMILTGKDLYHGKVLN